MFHLFCILFLHCSDEDTIRHPWINPGRIDYGNMCDLQRIENLLGKLEKIPSFMSDLDDGNVENVCNCPGINCDNDGVNVLQISWYGKWLKGSMDLSWIPPTVTYFDVSINKITGTIDRLLAIR